MTQVKSICDKLLSAGTNDFIIVSSAGKEVISSGDFSFPERKTIAAAIFVQLKPLIKANDTLKRVVMTFDDCSYVATTFGGASEDETYGVIVKHPIVQQGG